MTVTQALDIGAVVPDFSLPALDGTEVWLSQFLGERVILFMWASW